jgi:hypothetical protein
MHTLRQSQFCLIVLSAIALYPEAQKSIFRLLIICYTSSGDLEELRHEPRRAGVTTKVG